MDTITENNSAKSASAEPAYIRIKNYVLANIQSGLWKEGQMIPTEMALCESFGVSRMTVNRALRELVLDNLLVRQKGSGTFVARPKYQSTLIEIRSIAQDIRERGHKHHSTVLLRQTLRCTAAQGKQFGIATGAQLFHSVIVHYENEVAIQVEDRLVDAQAAPEYPDQDWEKITPNEYLMRVAPLPTGNYMIEIRLPTQNVAHALDIDPAQPCLVMERTTFSNNAFTSHATMWHPGNRFRFTGSI